MKYINFKKDGLDNQRQISQQLQDQCYNFEGQLKSMSNQTGPLSSSLNQTKEVLESKSVELQQKDYEIGQLKNHLQEYQRRINELSDQIKSSELDNTQLRQFLDVYIKNLLIYYYN